MRLVLQGLCREVVNRKNTLRTVRQRTTDGPHVLGRFCQRQCQSGCSVKIQMRTVRQDIADSPRMDRMVGSARLLIMGVPLTPPTKPHTSSKSTLSFSLKHVGETTSSRLFGVVPGRSENIPGLFSKIVDHVISVF